MTKHDYTRPVKFADNEDMARHGLALQSLMGIADWEVTYAMVHQHEMNQSKSRGECWTYPFSRRARILIVWSDERSPDCLAPPCDLCIVTHELFHIPECWMRNDNPDKPYDSQDLEDRIDMVVNAQTKGLRQAIADGRVDLFGGGFDPKSVARPLFLTSPVV